MLYREPDHVRKQSQQIREEDSDRCPTEEQIDASKDGPRLDATVSDTARRLSIITSTNEPDGK